MHASALRFRISPTNRFLPNPYEGGYAAAQTCTGKEKISDRLRIAQALRTWVGGHQDSLEYRSIAERAASYAITTWHSRQREQGILFGPSEDAANVWGRASNGAGFCELSRLFFAKFTERYLNYFLRTGSACSSADD
jgi:hypothetical protein